jgi:GxxExxY protein
MDFDQLSNRVIGLAIEVHRHPGPGLLESAYEQCLAIELNDAGIPFRAQCPFPIQYKGKHIDFGYRIDVLVAESLVLELKCVERLLPIHEAQLLTYMKLTNIRTGLLINFNVPLLKDGIRRMVL